MKFKYIGKCAKAEVVFTTPSGTVVMAYGEPVEVPESLAKKLAGNNHFEAVEEEPEFEHTDNLPDFESPAGQVETVTKRRGRPRKSPQVDSNDADGTEDSDAS